MAQLLSEGQRLVVQQGCDLLNGHRVGIRTGVEPLQCQRRAPAPLGAKVQRRYRVANAYGAVGGDHIVCSLHILAILQTGRVRLEQLRHVVR